MHENRNLFLYFIEINHMHRTGHILPIPRTCIWGRCGRCGVSWHRSETLTVLTAKLLPVCHQYRLLKPKFCTFLQHCPLHPPATHHNCHCHVMFNCTVQCQVWSDRLYVLYHQALKKFLLQLNHLEREQVLCSVCWGDHTRVLWDGTLTCGRSTEVQIASAKLDVIHVT